MMKKIVNFLVLVISLLLLVTLSSCNKETATKIVDTKERPTDIPSLVENKYQVYPERRTDLSAVDKTKTPAITKAYASVNSSYRITDGETITIEYSEIENWSYVYLPIDNYYNEYPNIKITALGTGAERISIQALYDEMYDENNRPITVFQGDVIDNEQYFIMSFNDFKLLNSNYFQIDDTDLGEKTLTGLCLFIDSNPSQMKTSDKDGKLEITSIKFLKNDDEELEDRYVAPSISIGFMDAGYEAIKDSDTGAITINRAADTSYWTKAYLDIANYSSSYSAFNLKFNTSGVKTIYIALNFSVEGHNWLDSADIYRQEVTDGEHEAYIDFSAVQPTDIDNDFEFAAGYYVKNYRINSIQIYLDTYVEKYVPDFSASLTINELKFERCETEGTTISRGWNSGTSSIMLGDDIIPGGTGTINYAWYSEWYYLTMPVLNYETASKLVIKFEDKSSCPYIGIAIVGGGSELVLHSSWEPLNGNNTEIEEKSGSLEGVIEAIEYSKTTKIYTFTFDFTNAVKLENYGNKSVNEMTITALRFFLNDPNGGYFEGTKSIHFIYVEFIKDGE